MTDPRTTTRPVGDPSHPADAGTVLVVGATGDVGGKAVDALLRRGRPVRALVRPGTDASRLEARGVEIARGDMLDLPSLIRAMTGVDAVISTAAGYTRGDPRAHDIDTMGNSNLAEAARAAGVRRFVLTSILTCDRTPDVPHFWHKKLAEDRLESLGVPFVALRPGAFLDQVTRFGGNPFTTGRIRWLGDPDVPLTFVLTTDLAGYLADAVDAPLTAGERIDIGWDRPVSMTEVARIASGHAEAEIRVRALPHPVLGALNAVVGWRVPLVADLAAMVRWFDTGGYVARTHRQREVFGPLPTAEDAIRRFAERLLAAAAEETVAPFPRSVARAGRPFQRSGNASADDAPVQRRAVALVVAAAVVAVAVGAAARRSRLGRRRSTGR